MISFRKYGHNEVDEPRFTQPQMYSVIDKTPSAATQYKDALINSGALKVSTFENMRKRFLDW